jgi:hypothetical protein
LDAFDEVRIDSYISQKKQELLASCSDDPTELSRLREDWDRAAAWFKLEVRKGEIPPQAVDHIDRRVNDIWWNRKLQVEAAQIGHDEASFLPAQETDIVSARQRIDRVLSENDLIVTHLRDMRDALRQGSAFEREEYEALLELLHAIDELAFRASSLSAGMFEVLNNDRPIIEVGSWPPSDPND